MGGLFSHLPASRLSFAFHSPLKVLCSQSTLVLLFQCRLLCLLLTGLQKNVKCFSTCVLLRAAELTSSIPSASPLTRTRKGSVGEGGEGCWQHVIPGQRAGCDINVVLAALHLAALLPTQGSARPIAQLLLVSIFTEF